MSLRASAVAVSLLAFAAYLLVVPASMAQTPASCTFTTFNPPAGFSGDFFPMGINHFNTVVGGAYTANQNSEKGFTRFSGGGISVFGAPNALFTQLNKRNKNGTSVGQYSPAGQPGFPGVAGYFRGRLLWDESAVDAWLQRPVEAADVVHAVRAG